MSFSIYHFDLARRKAFCTIAHYLFNRSYISYCKRIRRTLKQNNFGTIYNANKQNLTRKYYSFYSGLVYSKRIKLRRNKIF